MENDTSTGLTVAYLRVSIAGQSNGLETQLAAIKKTLGGADPDRVFSDEASGRLTSRPEFDRMLDTLRAGDTLIVYSLSRVGRSALHAMQTVERLTNAGIIIRSVTEAVDTSTPTGRLWVGLTLLWAQCERELIVERTQAGLLVARAKGRVGGAKPRLTHAQARSLLRLYEGGDRVPDLADQFGVSVRSAWRYIAAAKASRAKVQGTAA